MSEGAYGEVRESDVSESGSKRAIPIPLTRDDLECVDVRRDLTFCDIQVYVRPRVGLLNYVHEGYYILYGVCDECTVIRVPFAGMFETTRGDVVTLVRGREPADQMFDHEVEEERGHGVPLKCTPYNVYR